MWITSMLATLNSVVAKVAIRYHNVFRRISLAMTSIMAIGFGGYQANVIQFGLDQLQDASTTEITAFICWYVWTYFSNSTVMSLLRMCTKKEHHIFVLLIACTCVTLVVSSLFLFENSLTKEPKTQNPITLIYKVIRYAVKHKYPEQRSAFTYCEDELPSRIDFGKTKYGGPFTTEQVEDVKTFLRLLVLLIPASAFMGEIIALENPNHRIFFHIQVPVSTFTNAGECYLERFFTVAFGSSIIVILVPLYEFVVYPILHKYLPSVKIYQKFLAGMALQLARLITLIVLDVAANKTYIEEHGKNITINCFSYLHTNSSISSKWIALALLLQSTSLIMLSIGGIEFLASQMPYSMRGLITSTGYGSIFLFVLVEYGIYWPFTHLSTTWGKEIISCEFWYLFSVLLVLIA